MLWLEVKRFREKHFILMLNLNHLLLLKSLFHGFQLRSSWYSSILLVSLNSHKGLIWEAVVSFNRTPFSWRWIFTNWEDFFKSIWIYFLFINHLFPCSRGRRLFINRLNWQLPQIYFIRKEKIIRDINKSFFHKLRYLNL